jgi:hypothetical protein
MCHGNRKSTYVMLGIAGVALALAFPPSLGHNCSWLST